MTSAQAVLWAALVVVGVAGSALWSGMETGVYGLNAVRLHVHARRARGGRASRRARILHAEMEPMNRLLAALLIGNNITNYAGVLGVSALLTASGLSEWAVVVVNAVALTPLLFVFGETVPKDVFRASADRLMPPLATTLRALRIALTVTLVLPLVRLCAAGIARLVGVSDPSAVATARGRLLALLKEGQRYGVLSPAQAILVERAGRLRDRRVADVMTRWPAVVTLGADWSRARIEGVLRRAGRRVHPVVDRRGRVIGVVETAHVWLEPDIPLTTLMRPPVWIDADLRLVEALPALRRAGSRRALVRRRGKPVGLVVERDLLEPLLGKVSRR